MPKKKGRGRIIKTRAKRLPGGNSYLVCDVYEKAGPKGGKTVCHKKKKKKKRKGS
jgi:hypothetical protein